MCVMRPCTMKPTRMWKGFKWDLMQKHEGKIKNMLKTTFHKSHQSQHTYDLIFFFLVREEGLIYYGSGVQLIMVGKSRQLFKLYTHSEPGSDDYMLLLNSISTYRVQDPIQGMVPSTMRESLLFNQQNQFISQRA